MNLKGTLLAAVAVISLTMSALAADDDYPNVFVKMCDERSDKKVKKEEVMDTVSRMFDKADTRKEGKLDKEQAEAFLRMLTAPSGG